MEATTAPSSVRTPGDVDTTGDREWLLTRPEETSDVSIDETDDGQTEITVPISSTTPHRSGSRMSESALEAMASQLREGTVGLWDDHGLDDYGWPEYRREDMYGWWVAGEVEDGVLYGTARLREGDERSDDLVDQLDQGMPIGFSVGYTPTEEEWVEADDGDLEGEEERVIRDVDLLETSPVGIPDNPRAYADGSASAARTIAHSVAESGIDLDRQAATVVADGVTDALEDMSETASEGGDDPADEDGTGSETNGGDGGVEHRQFSDEEVEEILDIVGGAIEENMSEALDEIGAELQGEGEEEAGDGEDDEEEESGGDDGDDDDDEETNDALEEIRAELAAVREENEELRAKVDRLNSETRDSAGRKGMAAPGQTDDGEPSETSDADAESTDTETDDGPTNALDEAIMLGGD